MDFFICGDFNGLSTTFWKSASMIGLINVVNFPTRSNKIYDCIFTDLHNMYFTNVIAPISTSDHNVVLCRPIVMNKKRSKVYKKVLDFSNNNLSKFDSMIKNTDLTSLCLQDTLSIDEKFEIFIATLLNMYEICFPLKTVIIKCNDKPWISNRTRLCIKARNNAFSRNNLSKYKYLRKKVKNMIRKDNKYFVDHKINLLNTKNDWTQLKKFAGLNKKNIFSNDILPNDINNHFASVYSKTAFDIKFNYDNLRDVKINVSQSEVNKLLKSSKKNGGLPLFPAWILSKYSQQLTPLLTTLINLCFENYTIPLCLKIATIIPIPKKLPFASISDLRPISLLNPISKVIEKLMFQHLLKPLIKNSTFKDQFAFVPLPGRGAPSAVTLVY